MHLKERATCALLSHVAYISSRWFKVELSCRWKSRESRLISKHTWMLNQQSFWTRASSRCHPFTNSQLTTVADIISSLNGSIGRLKKDLRPKLDHFLTVFGQKAVSTTCPPLEYEYNVRQWTGGTAVKPTLTFVEKLESSCVIVVESKSHLIMRYLQHFSKSPRQASKQPQWIIDERCVSMR